MRFALAGFAALFLVAQPAGAQTEHVSDSEARCAALFEAGVEAVSPYFFIGEAAPPAADARAMTRAIAQLQEAERLCPSMWQAFWFEGKAQQALGRHREALGAFRGAHAINPSSLPVVNEMTIEAVEADELAFALDATRAGLATFPSSLDLRARLALVLLLRGEPEAAVAAANDALVLAPGDAVARNIRDLAAMVRDGAMRQPRTMAELMALAEAL